MSLGTVSSALDPRSMRGMLPTLGSRTQLQNGIVFWARLNALIVLGLTVVMRMTDWWFETAAVDVPWAALTLAAMLLSTSLAVARLRLDQR